MTGGISSDFFSGRYISIIIIMSALCSDINNGCS